MKATIDSSDIKNKITEINNSQSTLNKDFTFKTHSGSVISVKGQGYGWAINVEKEAKRIQEAFEKGKNRFLPLTFTEMVGITKASVMKQQRIMALETRMRKCRLRNNKFGFTKMENWQFQRM